MSAPKDRKQERIERYCPTCAKDTEHHRSYAQALWTCENEHPEPKGVVPQGTDAGWVRATLRDGTVLEGPPEALAAVLANLATVGSAQLTPAARTTINDIRQAACAMFRLAEGQLDSTSRERSTVYPRMLAMYFCRQHLGASFGEIGAAFGDRDHTTVMHAVRKIQDRLDRQDTQVHHDIQNLHKATSR